VDQRLSYHDVFVVHSPGVGDLFVVWMLLGATVLTAIVLLDRRYTLERGSLTAARIAVCILPVLAGVAAIGTFREFNAAKARYHRGAYAVVEGRVSDMVFGSMEGHRPESFRVGGQVFRYSSSTISPYFHRTAEWGGPIFPGLRVRISHVDGDILRVEAAP
jgi:ABC-type Co2+ transport system permease subunit